jgi:hypothetical protein
MIREILLMIEFALLQRPITGKRKEMRKDKMEETQGPNLIRIATLLALSVLILLFTDPTMIEHLPFRINGTILALINIINFSYIGFIMTTLLPDFYMDKEYKNVDKTQIGLMKIARSIHTLALGIIYATLVYVFIN